MRIAFSSRASDVAVHVWDFRVIPRRIHSNGVLLVWNNFRLRANDADKHLPPIFLQRQPSLADFLYTR